MAGFAPRLTRQPWWVTAGVALGLGLAAGAYLPGHASAATPGPQRPVYAASASTWRGHAPILAVTYRHALRHRPSFIIGVPPGETIHVAPGVGVPGREPVTIV